MTVDTPRVDSLAPKARSSLRFSVIRAALVAIAPLFSFAPATVRAQSAGPETVVGIDQRIPAGTRLVDLSVRSFGKSDGLQSPTVYSVAIDLHKRLWIGTEAGPMRYEGDRWKAAPFSPALTNPQTRVILQASDSSYWFATRAGVVRRRGNEQTVYGVGEGLPGSIAYSLIETKAFSGTPRIVAGTGSGVAMFDGKRFVAIELPRDLEPSGLMLGETRARDGSAEVWVASSLGKVARFANGKWTVFGPAQGLVSRASETIVPTFGDPDSRLLVPGEAGVFAFRDDGPKGERFELLPGSPRMAYRAQEIRRRDGAREIWVGTLRGAVVRRTVTGWDTVNTSPIQPGGRVTTLQVVEGHAGGTAVYVGTYGGRLARVGVGSVGALEVRGMRPDVALSVMTEERGPRQTLWIGTLTSGVVHIDEAGKITEYSRETGQSFGQVLAVASLASNRQPASTPEVEGTKELWIGTDVGVYRRRGTTFVPETLGMGPKVIRALVRGPLPDGTTNLMATTDTGVFRWTGNRWQHIPEFGTATVRAATVTSDANGPVLWLAMYRGMASSSHTAIKIDTLEKSRTTAATRPDARRVESANALGRPRPLTADVSLGNQLITGFCGISGARLNGLMFAGTVNEGLWWKSSSSEWARVPVALQQRWGGRTIRTLSCVDDRNLLIAVEQGIVIVDVQSPTPEAWRIRAVGSVDDGLPATEIQSFASHVSRGIVWTGTSRGVGAVQMHRVITPPFPALGLLLNSEGQPVNASSAIHLRAGRSDLTIRPMLLGYHRESDAQFQIHLDRDGERYVDASTAASDSAAWTDAPETQYRAIAAGNYTLRVLARDYMGRVVTLPELKLRAEPPVWRRWWAFMLYSVIIAGIIYASHRWRLHTLERTNAQLAASERLMRASERKFRALFDEASDAHFLIDDANITSINNPARALLGLEEVPPNSDRALQPLAWRSLFPEALANDMRALAADGRAREFDIPVVGGDAIPVSAQIATVPLDDRTLWHLVLRDLRSAREADDVRKRLEEQVRDAQKFESLGTLAGGVAHDFNNLLGVIRGNVELAMVSLDDNNAVAAHLGTVFDASERARDLVRQILTFSRRSSSREERVDLARLTRDLHPMLRSMIPTTIDVVVEIARGDLHVYGDPTQLQQILLNLSSNAEYAMRATSGGRLLVELDATTDAKVESDTGRVIRLRVSDTGAGMTPAVQERVFEPFYTTKPIGEGTGLGLAVLHGIVASHGGRISVSSSVNVGTTFEILFPAAEPGSITSGPVSSGARPVVASDIGQTLRTIADIPPFSDNAAGSSDSWIVVVDDEPAVARVGEAALLRLGYKVRTFTDPAAALAFVELDPRSVGLVITDQTMPGLTGDVLAIELHKLRPDLPIIISSGYSYVLSAERLAEMGSPIVLQKPVSLTTLRAAVEAALGQYHFEFPE